jgi:hypothetical protein
MALGPDMMGDEANDPLAVTGPQPFACVRKSILPPVDPDAAIRIEHDFDDAGTFKPCRDRRRARSSCGTSIPYY